MKWINLSQFETHLAIPLHVLVACRNRRDLTVRAIAAFAAAAKESRVNADFTVFDDGSTDGTAEALAALDLPVVRIAGDGSAFWSRSMAEAEKHVLFVNDDNGYIVWLNDDVDLDRDFLQVALAAAEGAPSAILVGAMRDPQTAQLTYSGSRRVGYHPLRGVVVEPDGTLQSIDTFNGNLVFVPMDIARALGGIDGSLSHFGADTDYGIRAREKGYSVLLLPRIVGSCARNPMRATGSLMEDWRTFVGVKGGGNYNTLKRILRKRYPHSWLGYIVLTYSLWWIRRSARIASHAVAGDVVRVRQR